MVNRKHPSIGQVDVERLKWPRPMHFLELLEGHILDFTSKAPHGNLKPGAWNLEPGTLAFVP